MKKILLCLLSAVVCISSFSQLQNTRWKGTIKGDNPRNVILDFKKDQVVLYTVSDSEIVERMTYGINQNIITLKKIDGQSDCDNATLGQYKFKTENQKMTFALSSDQCSDRSSAFDATKWTKWKDHPEINVEASVLKQYVGVYEFNPDHLLTITLENGKLFLEGPANNLPKSPLIPESKTLFFLKIAGVEIQFVKNADGKVIKFISHEEDDHDVIKIK
jgi:hypothetical protein